MSARGSHFFQGSEREKMSWGNPSWCILLLLVEGGTGVEFPSGITLLGTSCGIGGGTRPDGRSRGVLKKGVKTFAETWGKGVFVETKG